MFQYAAPKLTDGNYKCQFVGVGHSSIEDSINKARYLAESNGDVHESLDLTTLSAIKQVNFWDLDGTTICGHTGRLAMTSGSRLCQHINTIRLNQHFNTKPKMGIH